MERCPHRHCLSRSKLGDCPSPVCGQREPVYPAAGDGRRRASVKSGWTYVGWEGGSEHMLVAGGWSEEA